MTTANIYAPLGAVTVLRVVDAIFNAKSNLIEWNESRRTRKLLSQLTDTQLDDIGLSRSDIAAL